MDLRVGGDWSARMVLADGTEIGWHGTYLEVEAPHRLVLSLSDRPGEQFERVLVVLKEVQAGTEMTFTQSGGHTPPENYAKAEEGWRSFLTTLRKDSTARSCQRPGGLGHLALASSWNLGPNKATRIYFGTGETHDRAPQFGHFTNLLPPGRCGAIDAIPGVRVNV